MTRFLEVHGRRSGKIRRCVWVNGAMPIDKGGCYQLYGLFDKGRAWDVFHWMECRSAKLIVPVGMVKMRVCHITTKITHEANNKEFQHSILLNSFNSSSNIHIFPSYSLYLTSSSSDTISSSIASFPYWFQDGILLLQFINIFHF